MKIALINPGRLKKWAGAEPLSLGYIASYLEAQGHELRIFDELAGDDVVRLAADWRPEIAGITAVTPVAKDGYRIAAGLKRLGILTVMGGIHVKFLPDDAFENGIDVVAHGAGETAMAKIIDQGITSGIVDGPLPRKDLDRFPKPARHLFADVYHETPRFVPNYVFVPKGRRSARLITSRGCAYSCSFCHNSLGKKRVLFHSPERVVEEIEDLVTRYDVDHIFFIDDNFLMRKKRVVELCELILSKGLKVSWALQATSNEIHEEHLPLLRRAGCKQIVFGFESGSQKILDVLQKRTTVEHNEWALRKSKESGFITQTYILVGNPTETVDDLEQTKAFVRRNLPYLDSILTSFVAPFPGTAIYEEMRADGRMPDATTVDWSKIRYDTPSFPVNQEVDPTVLRRYYFEIIGLRPPSFGTIVSRALSDPFGVLANVARTDKRAIVSTLLSAIRRDAGRGSESPASEVHCPS